MASAIATGSVVGLLEEVLWNDYAELKVAMSHSCSHSKESAPKILPLDVWSQLDGNFVDQDQLYNWKLGWIVSPIAERQSPWSHVCRVNQLCSSTKQFLTGKAETVFYGKLVYCVIYF